MAFDTDERLSHSLGDIKRSIKNNFRDWDVEPSGYGECTMMNKTNYKTIAVVAVNNVALAMSAENKQYKHMKKFGQNNLIASLKVLKSILDGIDDNSNITNEPRLIVVGSKSPIKGFATGTFVEYIRTGQNASGKAFTDEEMSLINDCVELYANKCFNFRITTDEFISYKDKDTKALINNAWTQVKKVAEEMQKKAKEEVKEEKQKQDNQANDVIAKLNEQLISAVSKGDFETATKITELIKNLQTAGQEVNKAVEEMDNDNDVEIPDDVKSEDPDTLAGVDDME